MRAFIIAEIGCNWGSWKYALKMIEEAKNAGADAIKFQLFNEEVIRESPLFGRLQKMILLESDVAALKREADKHKLKLVLTPMYGEAVETAAKYADYIKIRFKDHENMNLIQSALDTGKTVLLSEAYHPDSMLMRYHPQIKHLYCIPKYPPAITDFNMDYAACFDGFSDHYPHNVCALAYAACTRTTESIIEKHVMLGIGYRAHFVNLNQPGPTAEIAFAPEPIDADVSIGFHELAELVHDLRLIEQMQRTPKI